MITSKYLFLKTLLFVLFLLNCYKGYSQNPEFKVKSFMHEQNRLLARIDKNIRLDDNDEVCALILVRTAETGLGFAASSGIIGDVDWRNGEYWVFVSHGNRTIKIFKKGIKATEYVLDILPESAETYLLDIEVVRPEPKINNWPITIIVQPENATISIDGEPVDKKLKTIKLSEGEHSLVLEMPGYEKLEKTLDINENNVYFNFKLPKITGVALMIESEPSEATVYLDGVKLGETPLSAFYPQGTYPVKVEKEGYVIIENQNLTVAPPQTQKKYTLEENVGYITINTYETAKVYFNGTEYPEHKNIKLSPQLINIKVTMPKASDVEQQLVLKRNDQLNIDLYPDAATGTIQIAVTPFDATIELAGDAGEHYTADGMHIFRDIPIGQYTLKVKAEGYATTTETITLNANQVLDKNIKLEKGPSGDIEMVFVKGGTFTMGCTSEQNDCGDDEKPAHEVTVDDFYIGKYEVTIAQFKQFIDEKYYRTDAEKGGWSYVYTGSWEKKNGVTWKCDVEGKIRSESDYNHPVIHISWNDAIAYCDWLSKKTEQNYRLPTEAEWEYAARGGVSSNATKYAGNNNIDEVAWYWKNSGNKQLNGAWDGDKIKNNNCKTHPVGQKQPNELGIYDMTGNVWEWCSDWYGKNYYKKSLRNNPQGTETGTSRVYRGGSWGSSARYCRVAYRYYYTPDYRYNSLGFRLVLVS